ncbi:MAG: ClbS/DfsB family four-helix bundle protein [Flavobacteriales bacterium]|nr:ClbS/DfsB family four-helix bundle protein [Flavobacteriales bacterium]
MSRPTTKKQLSEQSSARFAALNALIDGMPQGEREREFRPGMLNRNIRDVLAHLHHWHSLFLQWYATGMNGTLPDMPAKGYTWAQTRALNVAIQRQWRATPLKKVRSELNKSHAAVEAIIEQRSEVDLFTKRRFLWTGSTSLASYLTSATCSHYDWAMKVIRKGLK